MNNNLNSKEYGVMGEKIAHKLLSSIFNSIVYDPVGRVDFICQDNNLSYYVEVKSCLQQVTDHSHDKNTRSGRFNLNRLQYNYIRALRNSFYLFIEFQNDLWMINKIVFIKVKDLNLCFNGVSDKAFTFESIMEIKE